MSWLIWTNQKWQSVGCLLVVQSRSLSGESRFFCSSWLAVNHDFSIFEPEVKHNSTQRGLFISKELKHFLQESFSNVATGKMLNLQNRNQKHKSLHFIWVLKLGVAACSCVCGVDNSPCAGWMFSLPMWCFLGVPAAKKAHYPDFIDCLAVRIMCWWGS